MGWWSRITNYRGTTNLTRRLTLRIDLKWRKPDLRTTIDLNSGIIDLTIAIGLDLEWRLSTTRTIAFLVGSISGERGLKVSVLKWRKIQS